MECQTKDCKNEAALGGTYCKECFKKKFGVDLSLLENEGGIKGGGTIRRITIPRAPYKK